MWVGVFMGTEIQADSKSETAMVMQLLSKIRLARKISQDVLAEKMGTHQTSVSVLERSSNPRLDQVAAYAEAIGVPLMVSIVLDGDVITQRLAG